MVFPLIALQLLLLAVGHIAEAREVCQTEGCKRAGLAIYQAINFSVDPCEDFFDFACGNWIATHKIADADTEASEFDQLEQELNRKLKVLLETTKSEPTKAASINYLIDLFNQCEDLVHRESLGIKPIQSLLAKTVGQWPILKPTEANKKIGGDWIDIYVESLFQTGIGSLFTLDVAPDGKKTSENLLAYRIPTFGLGRKQHADPVGSKSLIEAYKKSMEQVATVLVNRLGVEKLVKEKVENIFDFEHRLALASAPMEKYREPSFWYNRMTFAEFNELTNQTIDWVNVTNRIFERFAITTRVNKSSLVLVTDIPYFTKVAQILTHQASDFEVRDYIGWTVANAYADHADLKLADIKLRYTKVALGVTSERPTWLTCKKQIYDQFSWAMSRMFVDRHFTKETRAKTKLLIEDIRAAYEQLIRQATWLDEPTRAKALEKLKLMVTNVAYPDWLQDNAMLDKYHNIHNQTKVIEGQYLLSLIKAKQLALARDFDKLHQPVDFNMSWAKPPAVVNAAYNGYQNSITIAAAIIDTPFFKADRPAMMNYGAMGMVIGHEFTHGFDDAGRHYDAKGQLENWWSNTTEARFRERAQCIIKQYSDIFDVEAGKYLNGANSVGENVADNGGVREAILAYRNYVARLPGGDEPAVPHLTNFTSEQIFHLANANIWCGKERPEYIRMEIDYDNHSPGRFRVNEPLKNLKEFSEAFKCSKNSKMNKEGKERCIVW